MNTIYQLTRKEDHAGAHVDMLRSQVQGQINRCIMYYILNYRFPWYHLKSLIVKKTE